jgi:formate/nitrite transporter
MQTQGQPAGEKDKEFKSADMVWTRIYYGREVMERILDTIDVKRALHQRFFVRYTLRAAMAGVIICLMYVFVYQIKADLGADFNSALSKYLMGVSFSMALVFIYFTNSELLTSNFMYFTVGRYYEKVSWSDTMKIWGMCLVGNLIGIAFIAMLVWSCGMLSDGVLEHLVRTVDAKTVNSGVWLIFIKAIFANYFINVSVIVAMQLTDHLAKIVVLMMGVTVFAYMGFEHVIANSALFAIALFERPESISLLHVGKNFFFSLLGNYVGGGLVIGLFYAYLNDHRGDALRVRTN